MVKRSVGEVTWDLGRGSERATHCRLLVSGSCHRDRLAPNGRHVLGMKQEVVLSNGHGVGKRSRSMEGSGTAGVTLDKEQGPGFRRAEDSGLGARNLLPRHLAQVMEPLGASVSFTVETVPGT